MSMPAEGLLRISSDEEVSTLLLEPGDPAALYVLAHGAGAGMDHAFMEAVARGLHDRGVATLRYNFPYMEGRGWPPDGEELLVKTVRAAVARGAEVLPGVPLVAGGKSLGGRMASRAALDGGLPGVAGLAFLGFPLHGKGKPGTGKGRHLPDVALPSLFVQGTRDRLTDLDLLRGLLERMAPEPVLHVVEGADHGFHVLQRSGRTDEEVVEEVCDTVDAWVGELVSS